MRIKIASKLRPFSHLPGIRCIIPFSTCEAQIFPTKIFFHDLATGKREEQSLPVQGPVKGFTVLYDMEKGRLEVFGKAQSGYFRHFITADRKVQLPPSQKRLSLGFHKKQDWELIQRRAEMGEIFPYWLRLAEIIPEVPFEPIGTGKLLAEGKLELTFQAAFQGMLSPRLNDENYLGLIPEIATDKSPLGIIHEGARQIERLFFYEEKGIFHFLPKLPKELHAGRFINIPTAAGDVIDMEWSKKELKKVVIRAGKMRTIHLKLQSQLHKFRLNKKIYPSDQPLELQEGKTYFLDRFTH